MKSIAEEQEIEESNPSEHSFINSLDEDAYEETENQKQILKQRLLKEINSQNLQNVKNVLNEVF